MTKPATCKCDGASFRTHGDRWVVVARRTPGLTSQVKCLECNWKWWSKRKYIGVLRDHTERSRSGMTDDDILHRLIAGTLFVHPETADVFSFNDDRCKWIRITPIEHESNRSKYRFVSICHNGLKKKIAVHRLAWMAGHLKLVPEGYDVDHINGKQCENPDAIQNLRLLDSSTNRSRNRVSSGPKLFEDEF